MEFVPILGYHRIVPDNTIAGRYELTENGFQLQMEMLKKKNYRAITIDDADIQNIHLRKDWQNKIMLTFDDGYASDYNKALPLLKKYDFKATFFVTASLLNTTGYLSRSEIMDISDAGMSIQSHSYNHFMLPRLTKKDIYYELKTSKESLEKILKNQVNYISLPGGQISGSVVKIAREIGYRGIFTSQPGYTIKKVGNMLIFKRFILISSTPPHDITAISNKDLLYNFKAKSVYFIKYIVKKLIIKSK